MMKPDSARLAKDARRIARILPDNRSFVLIGYDPAPANLSVAGLARDINAVILQHFGRQSTLLGISYGAVVAAHVATRFPDSVGKLVLMAGAHEFSTDGRLRLIRQAELARKGLLKPLIQEFTSVFRRPWLNLLLWFRIGLGGNRLVSKLGRREVIVRYLEAMLKSELPASDLKSVTADTLIIGGSRDQFFAGTMPMAAQAIPAAKLVMFDGETHMVPVERAGKVKAQLAAFFRRD
ncbi:alpha/beta hydrolase [Rhizobium herbae]|uniref:Alpha/beta hydrolase n=2 Tax=Rhizobium herbae TaxID=508661 RepID=A0ABS7HA44_9HYPH|nr:alpha/beta hydrolase [Rhizobium herbae]